MDPASISRWRAPTARDRPCWASVQKRKPRHGSHRTDGWTAPARLRLNTKPPTQTISRNPPPEPALRDSAAKPAVSQTLQLAQADPAGDRFGRRLRPTGSSTRLGRAQRHPTTRGHRVIHRRSAGRFRRTVLSQGHEDPARFYYNPSLPQTRVREVANASQPDHQAIVAAARDPIMSRAASLRNALKRSVGLIAPATTGGTPGDSGQ